MAKLTRRQARALIRAHWAEFIANADFPADPKLRELGDGELATMWTEECFLIAKRLNFRAAFASKEAK